ncbi:MAG: hypothetical protein HON70_39370 [Lentisphaerae bacterium]|nr:hypothetical protein [Lentisphaerota bacterium]
MQLVCRFPAGIQAYSPSHPAILAQIPACCLLCESALKGKGVYFRQVWDPGIEWIEVRRLQCRRAGCRVTISLLPSFCVPFKRYSSRIIGSCLDWVLRRRQRIEEWCEARGYTDCPTAGSWVRQFRDGSGLLSTEGCVRLGIRQPGGSGGQAQRLWAALMAWAGSALVLHAVQPALCRRVPFLGVFGRRL